MSTRFRKSKTIAPGIKVNVSKKSVGVSAGVKGARVSVNSSGRVTKSVGVPGSGFSRVETSTIGKSEYEHETTSRATNSSGDVYASATTKEPKKNNVKAKYKTLYLIASILCFIVAYMFILADSLILGIVFAILGVMSAKNFKTAKNMKKMEVSKEEPSEDIDT